MVLRWLLKILITCKENALISTGAAVHNSIFLFIFFRSGEDPT